MEVADDLPQNEFDVVIVGTGMVESIVAAGAARIGKSVLHLDRNDYYGDFWATLGLESLQEFTKKYSQIDKSAPDNVSDSIFVDNSTVHPMGRGNLIRNVAYKWFIPSSIPEAKCDADCTEKKTEALSVSDISNTVVEDANVCSDNSNENKDISQESCETNDEKSSEPLETSVLAQEKEQSQSSVNAFSAGDKQDQQKTKPVVRKRWSVKELVHQSRKFNIDLAPKVIYCTGAMVDLLLRSCVYRYAEFQSVSDILARVEDDGGLMKLERVPCTKSQVFSSRSVSVVDKRILMKVLNFCMNFTQDSPQYEELKEELFIDYLKREKVPNHLIQYIFYSIAMATNITLFKDAASRVQCFLKNVGRYGNSPFLWPMYGSGELLQAFCRLSAVYGGVYYLSRGAEGVVTSNETNACTGVISNNKVIKAAHVVTSAYYCPPNFVQSISETKHLSRTILFTDRPIYSGDKEAVSILHLPSKDGLATNPIVIVELPSCTGSSPKEIYTVHITYEQSSVDWSEVRDVIDELFVRSKSETEESPDQFIQNLTDETLQNWLSQLQDQVEGEDQDACNDSRPRILFSFHYDLMDSSCYTFSSSKPANLHLCHGPDSLIDFDRAIKQAKQIFTQMYPDEEFLEPTPDPNDITLSDLIGEESEGNAAQEQTNPELPNENTSESSEIPPAQLVKELAPEDKDSGESDRNDR